MTATNSSAVANGDSATDHDSENEAFSEYEKSRARNIQRNNYRLFKLGLISAEENRSSTDAAWGRTYKKPALASVKIEEDVSDGDEEYDPSAENDGADTGTRKRKKRSRSSDGVPREGSRKSSRLMGIAADGDSTGIKVEDSAGIKIEDPAESAVDRKERLRKERKALVEECREARQRAAVEVAKAGAAMAGKENPTATYEHCLMRVRSMTEKGLNNRVRAIERAAGKHCVVKMAIFKSCLQDEDMWDLAKVASKALERLKALLPPPPTD